MTGEQLKTEPFRCGHCSNVAPMEMVYYDSVDRSEEHPMGKFTSVYQAADRTELLRCEVCRGLTLRSYSWHEMMEGAHEIDFEVLYPTSADVPPGLPQHIETELIAGQKVKGISSDLFGIQMRRILELVCEQRLGPAEGKNSTLVKRLDELVARGDIPTEVAEIAHRLREFGNIGAHAMTGRGMTPESIPIVEKLCQAVLEHVYSIPKLIADAQAMLDRLKDKGSQGHSNAGGVAPPPTT